MSDIFKDIIPSILQTKKNVLENEKAYNAWVINRALSFHYDCILLANQMNKLPHVDKCMQYHFYLNSVRAYKRPYQKWQKKENNENQQLVKEYFGYSDEKAKEALRILSDDQIDMIRKKLYRGGTKSPRST